MTINKLSIFDYDNSLINSPSPEEAKLIWKNKTTKEWPYKGYWSKPESLDDNIFDFRVIDSTYNAYKAEIAKPDTLVILMTGRLQKLSNEVMTVLNKFGIEFDRIYFAQGNTDTLTFKLKKINELLTEFPNVKEINIWEDRIPHYEEFKKLGDELKENSNIDVTVNLVK